MYEAAAKPIIEGLFDGINGTIFAYGQTASGKTHTMQGVIDDENKKGITPRIINNIFEIISHSKTNIEFNVSISMIEIYMEKIRVNILNKLIFRICWNLQNRTSTFVRTN